jgi:hypothetical protein
MQRGCQAVASCCMQIGVVGGLLAVGMFMAECLDPSPDPAFVRLVDICMSVAGLGCLLGLLGGLLVAAWAKHKGEMPDGREETD